MDIDTLMSKHSNNYRFHGPRGFLSELIAQSETGEIKLWGRTQDDAVEVDEAGEVAEFVQGEGYLYCADIDDVDICFNEFCESGEIVLVLEKQSAEAQEWFPRSGRRERLIRVEEYKVIGGVRPLYDEDGDLCELEAISLEDILSENF